MFFIFLSHQWKKFWRGRNQAGNIVARILLGIFILYFLLLAVGLGFFMKEFIGEIFPGKDPITVFNGFIIYYFLADFLMRIQVQELPTLSIQPYLHLNIIKGKLINFLNTQALLTFFNLLPVFFLIPFCFVGIHQVFGAQGALVYVVAILSWIIFNNYLVLYLKRKSISNMLYLGIGVVIIVALGALDYFDVISVADLSDSFFRNMALQQPYWIVLFPLAAFLVFYINTRYLLANLYLEELSKKEVKKVSTDYPFLNRYGKVGQLAALELKLILRHKRSKSSLFMSLLFVFYGFIFYKSELIESNSFGQMMFAAIFMTGIFMVVYGQFMYAWQSGHFDGLLSNKVDFKKFIQAKFLLFTLASTAITLITFLYGFISWKLILLQLSVYLYNIGFGTVIVLFFANYNHKRLDLSKSSSFNWQGVSATQWIMAIPLIVLPFLIYLPFALSHHPFWGLTTIGLFGLATLALRNFWVNQLTTLFIKKRYKIAEGFRE